MMSTAGGIMVITVGAILRFAVSANVVSGVNMHVVGVILIAAGATVLMMSRFVSGSRILNRSQRRSRLDAINDQRSSADAHEKRIRGGHGAP
jgi:Domain of unknown function (DUF6458)